MDQKEVEILGSAIDHHWYYASKAAAVHRVVAPLGARTLLDVGAGSGFFSRYLLRETSASRAFCVDPAYERDWSVVENGKEVHFSRTPPAADVDLLLLMDVLEHVDDDIGLLGQYVSRARQRAHFLISVPALQFLWSAHDVFLEHKRRYTLRGLRDVVAKSGLAVIDTFYYFLTVLPLAACSRLAERLDPRARMPARSQLRKHSAPVNWMLHTVCRLELNLIPHNKIVGLTAFCLASKP